MPIIILAGAIAGMGMGMIIGLKNSRKAKAVEEISEEIDNKEE